MTLKCILTLALSATFSFNAIAQQPDSVVLKSLANQILTSGQCYNDLRELCTIAPKRLAGSPNSYKAINWGKKKLEGIAGVSQVTLQNCMVPHWVRGGVEMARVIDPKNKKIIADNLHVCALGGSVGTPPDGDGGLLYTVNNWSELDQLGKQGVLKGAAVYYNIKFDATHFNTFEAYGESVGYRAMGAIKAAQYGANCVLVRSMASNIDTFPHTGAMRYTDTVKKIPAQAIATLDADNMYERIKDNNGKFLLHMKQYCQQKPDTLSYNVIAEIKGTQYPDQIITVGGHLDAWDNCDGAHDDGAGIVQTIEVLRSFKALNIKPLRTIRFVLFMNEENGVRGGKAYAEAAKAKNENHIFALESDAGGFTPRAIGFEAAPEVVAKIKQWAPYFYPYGVYDWSMEGGGVDISPLKNMLNTPIAEMLPDSQRYFELHHTAHDTFDTVNERELKLGAVNMAFLIYLVSKNGL